MMMMMMASLKGRWWAPHPLSVPAAAPLSVGRPRIHSGVVFTADLSLDAASPAQGLGGDGGNGGGGAKNLQGRLSEATDELTKSKTALAVVEKKTKHADKALKETESLLAAARKNSGKQEKEHAALVAQVEQLRHACGGTDADAADDEARLAHGPFPLPSHAQPKPSRSCTAELRPRLCLLHRRGWPKSMSRRRSASESCRRRSACSPRASHHFPPDTSLSGLTSPPPCPSLIHVSDLAASLPPLSFTGEAARLSPLIHSPPPATALSFTAPIPSLSFTGETARLGPRRLRLQIYRPFQRLRPPEGQGHSRHEHASSRGQACDGARGARGFPPEPGDRRR